MVAIPISFRHSALRAEESGLSTRWCLKAGVGREGCPEKNVQPSMSRSNGLLSGGHSLVNQA